ncbi:MAG: hypothetical protein RLZZ219_1396 [Cyanobacteriota bacterium]
MTWLPGGPAATLRPRGRVVAAVGVAAGLLASQTLAASTPQASDVRLLLPSEGLLAGLGDGLRRGYGLAMEESVDCGTPAPSLQLGWISPGVDPLPALRAGGRSALLVAPPAAALEAFGQLAAQRQLTVLLPLQRGLSLEGLPQLPGADRLWPLVPARSLEVDRLAEALLADGIRRVMVVREPSAEGRSLSERFVAGFGHGRGVVIGPTGDPLSVDGDDRRAVDQLIGDVDWYRPPALVVLTSPDSALARRMRAAAWPPGLLLAWPHRIEQPLAQPQLGVDPLSRGDGWPAFARRFERRWGYTPGLVESAGYDTGLITALASVPAAGRPGWDLHWFSTRARPLPLCEALARRRAGAPVRPIGAASRLDLAPGVSPTATLRLSRAAARSTPLP